MSWSVKDIDRGARALVDRLRQLRRKPAVVEVGVLETGAVYPNGTSVVDVASWMEWGTDSTPERSFLRAWYDEQEPQVKEWAVVLFRQVAQGKLTREEALDRLGLQAVGAIQVRMAAGIPPPNAPSTVRQKGSSTPLIDTGTLRASVTHRVKQGT